jgi:hypothetical protein
MLLVDTIFTQYTTNTIFTRNTNNTATHPSVQQVTGVDWLTRARDSRWAKASKLSRCPSCRAFEMPITSVLILSSILHLDFPGGVFLSLLITTLRTNGHCGWLRRCYTLLCETCRLYVWWLLDRRENITQKYITRLWTYWLKYRMIEKSHNPFLTHILFLQKKRITLKS